MERYLVIKDFNTKDYYIYDNETNINVCYFNTKEEATVYLESLGKGV